MAHTIKLTGVNVHKETLLFGHGWIFLAPFSWDADAQVLSRPIKTDSESVYDIEVDFGDNHSVLLRIDREPNASDLQNIEASVQRMFRLGENLSDCWKTFEHDPSLKVFADLGAGALLRSPTLFEDVIKTICTTNCSWNNTKLMCERLCSFENGAFPSPETIVKVGVSRMQEHARMGYRADYVYVFSKRVLEGVLDPEAWVSSPQSERTLREISSIRGVGEYALRHILFLLGNYTFIPIDSEVRSWLSDNIFEGLNVSDALIDKYYDRYGKYSFLAYKFGRIARRDNYID